MKYKLTFALVASLTGTAFAAFQAPLPEFKNEKQLAEWRAEKASEAASQGYEAKETAFYTGRPYLASSGDYAFKYRSYNPEMARWTSEDSSGFPDGPNNTIYVNNSVLSAFDYRGLARQWVTGSFTMTANWKEIKTTTTGTQFSLSYPLSVQVSVTPSTSWAKWGQISTTKTAGEFAEQANAPSGWAWVDAPNSIVNPTSTTQDGSATYGNEYQQQIGTTTVVVLGVTISSSPVYGTLKDGSWKVTYQWKRLAEE
jgi:RHS repeat-associated protein